MNYFLGYVICCVVTKHTMLASDYITLLFSNNCTIGAKMITLHNVIVSNSLSQLCDNFQGRRKHGNEFHGNVRDEVRVNFLALFARNPHIVMCGALTFTGIVRTNVRLNITIPMLFWSLKFDYITELVLNYFLGYVICCVVTKHTMWASDYIT